MSGISWSGVLMRVVFAIALVLLTFNPSGHSFYHWFTAPPSGVTALKAFAGIALLIGWIICLRSAFVALGWLGVFLCAALFGTFVWLLFDIKLLHDADSNALAWIGLVVVGAILGIGLSWGLIRARTTGQIETQ
jgi:Family of unknown function (DUF6524)